MVLKPAGDQGPSTLQTSTPSASVGEYRMLQIHWVNDEEDDDVDCYDGGDDSQMMMIGKRMMQIVLIMMASSIPGA